MKGKSDLINIISARVLLSFSYGFLNILLSLYLHYIGYSFLQIGLILGAAIIINAVLAFLLSMMADHYGRKLFLVLLFVLFAISASLFLYTKDVILLSILSGLGGFTGSGGGPIGSGGPFGAIQTALITEFTERKDFSRILSIASVIGLLASSAGAFLVDGAEIAKINVYSLFYLAGILGIIGAAISLMLTDNKIRSKHFLPKVSWKNIIKLSIPTIPNGIGGGFVAPIFSLWFHLKFGLTSGQIGIIFGLSNLFTILMMYILPRFVTPSKELKTIIGTRIFSSLALILMAFTPVLFLTTALFVLRNGMQLGAVPIRQSFSMGIVDKSERATSSGTTSMVRTGFSSISPPIAGNIISMNIDYPPLIGGVITMMDPFLYYFLFRKSFGQKK
jgi:MFS family permease